MTSPIHHCGQCTECAEEPRASRMPPHLPAIDPHFLDAVFKEFVPEDALQEKKGSEEDR